MELKIKLPDYEHCTGCSACAEICPHRSITMEFGESLHFSPRIDQDKCISCGLCSKTCPSLNPGDVTSVEQKYYAAWHIDDNERMSSTSGGAGAALVSQALTNGWYVSGAALVEGFQLKHIVTNDVKEAALLKGSKYLQSSTINVFSRIKELALNGEHILFIGTPCQVEGLKRFLPIKQQENIITCGIICHGVNSPRVWDDYRDWLEETFRSKIEKYNFRSKSRGWQNKRGGGNLRVSYSFENGKVVDVPAWHNLFHWWFGNHFILRPSCFQCDYRKENRNSDITIGDFWNVERVTDDVDLQKGVSAIITSTRRGDDFVKSCGTISVKLVDAEASKQVLKGYIEKTPIKSRQNEIKKELAFEKEYLCNGFYKMRKRYPAQTIISHYIWALRAKFGI